MIRAGGDHTRPLNHIFSAGPKSVMSELGVIGRTALISNDGSTRIERGGQRGRIGTGHGGAASWETTGSIAVTERNLLSDSEMYLSRSMNSRYIYYTANTSHAHTDGLRPGATWTQKMRTVMNNAWKSS
jgi:hypothetical protein